jgi:mersacidin/lichenicidin family type 2 lantibiotic
MSEQNIIRAWKDAAYRQSLSEGERARLPENPAGLIELAGAELDSVGGGRAGGCWPGKTVTIAVSCGITCGLNDCPYG